MGNSAGLGRHARVLDGETESEGSEELLGEVKKDEHSRQTKEYVCWCEGSDARKDPAALEAEPSGWGLGRKRGEGSAGQVRETQGYSRQGLTDLAKNCVLRARLSSCEEFNEQERENDD